MKPDIKLLVTADLHLISKTDDAYRWDIFNYLKTFAGKANTLIILGDLTEQKDEHDSLLVNPLINQLTDLSSYFEIIILKGNHDYIETTNPFFKFLNEFENISFVTKPTSLISKDILFLPHTKTPVEDWKDIDFTKYKLVFMHQPIQGAVGMNGFDMKKGLPADYFKKYKHLKVFSGDIHKGQLINNVLYVGAPYPVHFGDDSSSSHLYLINLNHEKTIETFHYNSIKKEMVDLYREYAVTSNLNEGDQVKIIFHLQPHEVFEFDRLKKEVEKTYREKGIIIKSITMKKIVDTNLPEECLDMSQISDEEVIMNFVSKETLDSSYLNGALSIMREYRSEKR
jgi:hypothetical protein